MHPTLIPLFDELISSRIRLRPYQEADASAFLAAVDESRERLNPWDVWPQQCHTLADAQRIIAYYRADFIIREEIVMGIWQRETGQFLGNILLRPKDWRIPAFEIGYWLRSSAEGHGYMSEALRLVVDFAFQQMEAKRVMLRIDQRNERSLAVATRFGFVREGTLRNFEVAGDGRLRDMVYFALIPNDRLATDQ